MRWTLLIVSLLAVAAHAGNPASGAKQGRAALDADGDGYVSRTEAASHRRLASGFDAADANKDGKLDSAELGAQRTKMREQSRATAETRWKAADADGDGALSRAEAEQSMPRMSRRFGEFDSDGDGRVSRQEMHSHRTRGGKPD